MERSEEETSAGTGSNARVLSHRGLPSPGTGHRRSKGKSRKFRTDSFQFPNSVPLAFNFLLRPLPAVVARPRTLSHDLYLSAHARTSPIPRGVLDRKQWISDSAAKATWSEWPVSGKRRKRIANGSRTIRYSVPTVG